MKNKKEWPKCPWCGRAIHCPEVEARALTTFKVMSIAEYSKFEKAGRPPIFKGGYEYRWIRSKMDALLRGWLFPRWKACWYVEFALVLPYRKQHRWYDNPKSYAQAVRRLKKRGQLLEP